MSSVPVISYIDISSYTQNIRRNRRRCTVEDMIEMINSADSKPTTVFEIIHRKEHIIYFDIESIPVEQPDLIHAITKDLIIYLSTLDLNIEVFALTHNAGSRTHAGLSYHLYFPSHVVSKLTNMNIVLSFVAKDEYAKYKPFIDTSVYSKDRLFRITNSKGIPSITADRNNDIHRLVHGNIADTIIQNTEGKPVWDYKFAGMKMESQLNISWTDNNSNAIKTASKIVARGIEHLLNKSSIKTDGVDESDIITRCKKLSCSCPEDSKAAKFINSIITHYDEHNQSLRTFAMTPDSIINMLNMITDIYS